MVPFSGKNGGLANVDHSITPPISPRLPTENKVNFFSGELALQRGDKNEAMRLFNLSVAECPKAFIEYEGAELKALGQTP